MYGRDWDTGVSEPHGREEGDLVHTIWPPRSDRARWIMALTYKERQWQGPTNKGGEVRGLRPGVVCLPVDSDLALS